MATRLVVITGAGRGFGRALVHEFASAGWSVIALARDVPAPADSSGDVAFLAWDVRQEVPLELIALIGDRAVDLVINNAGRGAPAGGIVQSDPALVLDSVDVAVGGPMRLVASLLPALRRGDHATVVNVTSRLGSLSAQARGDFAGFTTSYAYRVAKAAQNMFTIGLAQEIGPSVRCIAVHPGSLSTEMGRSGSSKSPSSAAGELRQLVDVPELASPGFYSLGESALDW
jgi:NAD(P)-dependent dehydrogenase (short-subunit alcohol dehydrogenase family)